MVYTATFLHTTPNVSTNIITWNMFMTSKAKDSAEQFIRMYCVYCAGYWIQQFYPRILLCLENCSYRESCICCLEVCPEVMPSLPRGLPRGHAISLSLSLSSLSLGNDIKCKFIFHASSKQFSDKTVNIIVISTCYLISHFKCKSYTCVNKCFIRL